MVQPWGVSDNTASTGTVTVAANGLCTGVSTLFTTEAAIGNFITTDAETLVITTITNTTVCHVGPQTLGGSIATASANAYNLSQAPGYTGFFEPNGNNAQIFGIDTTEMGINFGTVLTATVTDKGSGYFGNAVITVSGGGGSSATGNAQSNSTGYINTAHITAAGSGYETSPTFAVAAPVSTAFNAASAVVANGEITIASNVLQNDDIVRYDVTSDNTAIIELTDGQSYFVVGRTADSVYLATEAGGTAITLTDGSSETGHTLTGETAVVAIEVGGSQGAQHAGWHKRTVGTGTKAGRVSYECLVATRITGDAPDDSEVPDS